MNSLLAAFLGTLIAFAGTLIGSAFVFFAKKKPGDKSIKLFLGFASGVMIAASIWSLLLPAADYSQQLSIPEELSLTLGFLMGAGFLFLMDRILPHRHPQLNSDEGPKSQINKATKLIFAVTLHNFPEGMAVGLAFALASISGSAVSYPAAFALAVGIAIQNMPEGAIISLPLIGEGHSKKKAFLYGTLSGVVEPLAGVLATIITTFTLLVIPWALSFAAGAMIYVVIDELVPDASSKHTDIGTIGAVCGFALMMLLDITLG